jgi:hypothetical protein
MCICADVKFIRLEGIKDLDPAGWTEDVDHVNTIRNPFSAIGATSLKRGVGSAKKGRHC